MSDVKPRIALIGHCGPDSYALRSVARSAVPNATVDFVTDETETLKAAAAGALLLVNRILEGDFDDASGQELIERLIASGTKKIMMVSNYPEAQAAAEKAGALPGFGKQKMHAEETRQLLRDAAN